MQIIKTSDDFLNYIRDQIVNGQNLSIRGVARCCGVEDTSLIRGAVFTSQKLARKLMAQGFEAAELTENGFPPEALILCLEYFAFESKAKSGIARQIMLTFGAIGIRTTLSALNEPSEVVAILPRQLPPIRDTIEYLDAADRIKDLDDPILRSYLMQSLYEDIGAKALPEETARHVPIAVLAREMGYTLKPGQDSQLGKYAKRLLEPSGSVPHGRYQVYTYLDNSFTREVISSFFN